MNGVNTDLDLKKYGSRMNLSYNPSEEELKLSYMRKIRDEIEIGTGYRYNNSDLSHENSYVCKNLFNIYLARYKKDDLLLFAKLVKEEKDDSDTIIRFGVSEKLNNNFTFGTEFKISNINQNEKSETTFCFKHEFYHGSVKASINNDLNLKIQTQTQITQTFSLEASLEADLNKGEKVYSFNFQAQ
jgi:hypothetical protein